MLKIRLQRSGRENIPFYRVVLADHHRPVKGKFIEKLGYYNPLGKPWILEVDTDRIQELIKKGAQPSSTLARLLKAKGLKDMEKFIDPMRDRKKKGAAEPSSAKAPEASAVAAGAPAPSASAPAPAPAPAKPAEKAAA